MDIRTKIVVTIGPERQMHGPEDELRPEDVSYLDMITWFFEEGVSVFRLNMSHRSLDGEQENGFFDAYRAARYHWESRKKEVAILGDLQGPKIRTGDFLNDAKAAVELRPGSSFTLHTKDEVIGNENQVTVMYEGKPFLGMTEQVNVGDQIWLGDGEALLEVREISSGPGTLTCYVHSAGKIKGRRGVSVKGVSFDLESFTEKDKRDLQFLLLTFGVDLTYVALSFVKTAEDILRVRCFIRDEYRKLLTSQADISLRMPSLIAKIETPEAVQNIEEILDVADGIMIARGDLGMQLDLEDLTGIQKRIVHTCNVRGKPVITATQMLDSMERNPIPTRAEITDVYNAILDGTDAVMLSGETSKGTYPIQAIRTLRKIAGRAEEDFFASNNSEDRFLKLLRESEEGLPKVRSRIEAYRANHQARHCFVEAYNEIYELLKGQPTTDRISHAACNLSVGARTAAIMAPTASGQTTRMVARFRSAAPIIGATHSIYVARKLTLCFGVYPLNILKDFRSNEEVFSKACDFAKRVFPLDSNAAAGGNALIKTGDMIVITAGYPMDQPGTTNLVKLHLVP
jgi:pyruvate kinase